MGKNVPEKSNSLTKKEVEDLLKKGAYGALMDFRELLSEKKHLW